MKYIIAILAVLAIFAGGYYYTQLKGTAGAVMNSQGQVGGPPGAAGINGSPNQGNLGIPRNDGTIGQVQQPGADGAVGSTIGANLALGIDNDHLISYSGKTLYTFSKDTAASSTCYGKCALTWPPYFVGPEDNVHNVQSGVTGKADTIIRADGMIQVTYNGQPLYYYVHDLQDGDMKGDKMNNVWFVAKP